MTIAPPPERKNFNSEKEYKEARKEWDKNFKRAMKEMEKGNRKINPKRKSIGKTYKIASSAAASTSTDASRETPGSCIVTPIKKSAISIVILL